MNTRSFMAMLGGLAVTMLVVAPSSAIGEDRIVLGGVEICGSAQAAEEYLKPRDPEKLEKWKKSRREEKPNSEGVTRVEFEDWNPAVGIQKGGPKVQRYIILGEYQGKVLFVKVFSPRDLARVDLRDWLQQLESKKGAPTYSTRDGSIYTTAWERPNGVTYKLETLYFSSEEPQFAALYVICRDEDAVEGETMPIW